ncbi:mCG147427 [Mus musculus]|nr:mCG147427 [Mus musculus]
MCAHLHAHVYVYTHACTQSNILKAYALCCKNILYALPFIFLTLLGMKMRIFVHVSQELYL